MPKPTGQYFQTIKTLCYGPSSADGVTVAPQLALLSFQSFECISSLCTLSVVCRDLLQSQLQGTHVFPMSTSQFYWLARGFAAQAGRSRAWECGVLSRKEHEQHDSGEQSFCVDGKNLSWERTVKCALFLLRINWESHLDNSCLRQKTKMQCMRQLRFCARCWITSVAFFYTCTN